MNVVNKVIFLIQMWRRFPKFCLVSTLQYHVGILYLSVMHAVLKGWGCKLCKLFRRYWEETGIVTGGQYNTNQGCQPYLVKACDHHVVGKKVNNNDL